MAKTDTTEKGLETLITQHSCLVNVFDERHFNNYNRVDEDFLTPHEKQIVEHIKTKTATTETVAAKDE